MGCKIIFDGQTYTEPQFREKLKEGLLSDLIAKGKFKEENIVKRYEQGEIKFEEITNAPTFTAEEQYHLVKSLAGVIIDERNNIVENIENYSKKQDSIVVLLSNKIKEKITSGTLTEKQITLLNKALKDIEKGKNSELIQYIVSDLSKLWKINISDDIIDLTQEVNESDTETLRRWNDDADFAYNHKNRTEGQIKMLFYIGKKMYSEDNLTGFAEPLDFNEEYFLIQQLMNSALTADDMLEKLKEYTALRPEYQEVYNALDSDRDLLNMFYTTFSLAYSESTVHLLENTDEGKVKVDIGNKTTSPDITLADRWFKSLMNTLQSQNVNYEEIQKDFNILKSKVEKLITKGEPTDVSEIHNELANIYLRLGINLSAGSKVFSAYTRNGSSLLDNLEQLNKEVFSKSGLQSLIKELKSLDDDIKNGKSVETTTESFQEFGNLRRFAKRSLIYERIAVNTMFTNVKGKMENAYHASSYLTDFFKVVDNEEEFLNFLLNELVPDPSMQYSNWLFGVKGTDIEGLLVKNSEGKYVLNMPVYNRFKRTKYDGIKNNQTDDGQRYTELGYNDWIFSLFLNYVKGDNKNIVNNASKKAIFAPLIPSDKSNIFLISFGRIPVSKADFTALKSFKIAKEKAIKTPIYKAVERALLQEIVRNQQAAEFMFNKDARGQYDVTNIKKENEYAFINYYHTFKDKIVDKNGKVVGRAFQFHNHRFLDNTGKIQTFDTLADKLALTVNGVVNPSFNGQSLTLGLTPEKYAEVQDFLLQFIESEIKTALEKTAPISKDISSILSMYESTYRLENKISKDVDVTKELYEVVSAELFLNYFIANVEQQNMFGLHPSFYKNDIDPTKRAAQLQGLGMKGNFSEKSFNLLTIRDAEVKKMLNSEKDVNIGDGQSYITVEAFEVRVKGLGLNKLSKYKNFDTIIQKLKGKSVVSEDGKTTVVYEELTAEEKKIIFQIQKNFYYDYKYSPKHNIRIPFQIKNSEAILAPQMVKGTELEILLQLTKQFNVSQINFESAEKVGTMSKVLLTDKTTGNIDLTNPEIVSQIEQGIRQVDYANLRQQLEVPNHIEDTVNKLGTQLARKIIDNLSNDAIYELDGKVLTGDEIKKEYFDVIETNIIESYNKLEKELNIKDGKLDLEKLSEVLIRNSTQIDANMMYALKVVDGQFNIPIFYGGFGDKFVTMLLSLATNNIINQKHPGGHAAQLSNAFFNKIKEKSETKKGFTTDLNLDEIKGINWLTSKDSGKLKYTTLEDGKIKKAEVLLPAWTKQFFINGELLDINDARLTEKVRTLLGYRIPTEAKYSAIVFEVVGFLPETFGSTIVLPDEFVAQSGADFDIDSIYMMQYNVKYNQETDTIDVIEYSSETTEEATEKRFAMYSTDSVGKNILDDLINDTTTVKWYNSRIAKANERALEQGKELKDYLDLFETQTGIKVDNIDALFYELTIFLDSLKPVETDLVGKYLNEELTKEEYQVKLKNINDTKLSIINFKNEVKDAFSYTEELGAKYYKYITNSKKKLGELKYEAFKKLSIAEQNTLKARQNRILDIYISIMTNPYHLNEIRSGSQFDSTQAAGDKVRKLLEGNKDTLLNPATLFAQLTFRVLNLSGRDLKGMSVNRDGLMSIMQHLKAQLVKPITIKIDDTNIYSKLSEQYGKDFNAETGVLTLRYIANSHTNNFNIVGEYITNYAAQSTAHILDNVKFPVPPNVNDFTFGVWRVPVELGATWEYATYFISQPILRKLTSNHQNNISITKGNKRDTSVNDTRDAYIREIYRTFKESTTSTIYQDFSQTFGKQKVNKAEKEKFLNAIKEFLSSRKVEVKTTFSEQDLISLHEYSVKENKSKDKVKYVEYLMNQLSILDLWGNYSSISQQLELTNSALSSDKKQVGPTFEQYDKVQNDAKLITGIVVGENNTNVISEVFKNGNYPILKTYQDYGHDVWVERFEQLFILRSNKELKHKVESIVKNGQVYTKKYKQHLYRLMLYQIPYFNNIDLDILLGKTKIDKTPIDVTNINDFEAFSLLSVYDKIELLQANKEKLGISSVDILHDSNLEVKVSKRGNKTISYNNKDKHDYLIKSFRDGLNGSNLFISDTLNDLIKFAFIDNGMTYGQNYNSLIPFEYLNENQNIQLASNLYKIQREGIKIDDQTINRTFAILNYTNNAIVPTIKWNRGSFSREDGFLIIDNDYYKSLDYQIKNKEYMKMYNPDTKDFTVYVKISEGKENTRFVAVNINTNLHQQLTTPKALDQINDDDVIKINSTRTYLKIGEIVDIPMVMEFGKDGTMNKREGIKADNTFDAILEGVRTAMSSKDGSLNNINVGDIITLSKGKDKIFVKVTDKREVKDVTPLQWASVEGYKSIEVQSNWIKGKKLSEYTQIVYEVIAKPGEDFTTKVKKVQDLNNLNDVIAKALTENKLQIDEVYQNIDRQIIIDDLRIKDNYLADNGKSISMLANEILQQFPDYEQSEIVEIVIDFMTNYPNGAIDYQKEQLPKFEEVTHNNVRLIKDSQIDLLTDTQITLQRELYARPAVQTGYNPATKERTGTNISTQDLLFKLNSLKGLLDEGIISKQDADKLGITEEELAEFAVQTKDFTSNFAIYKSLTEIGNYQEKQSNAIRARLERFKTEYGIVDENNDFDFSVFAGKLDEKQFLEFEKVFREFIHGANGFLTSFLHIRDIKFYNEANAKAKLESKVITEQEYNINDLVLILNQTTSNIENLKLQVENLSSLYHTFVTQQRTKSGVEFIDSNIIDDISLKNFVADPLIYTNNPVVQNIIKEQRIRKGLIEREGEELIEEFQKKYNDFIAKGGRIDMLFDTDANGNRTGRLLNYYNIDEFENQLKEEEQKLAQAKADFEIDSKEYKEAVKAYSDWLTTFTERKYQDNFYEQLKQLPEDAVDFYNMQTRILQDIYDKYKAKNATKNISYDEFLLRFSNEILKDTASDELKNDYETFKNAYVNRDAVIIEQYGEGMLKSIKTAYKSKKKNLNYRKGQILPKRNKFVNKAFNSLNNNELIFLEYTKQLLKKQSEGVNFGIVKDGYIPVLLKDGRDAAQYIKNFVGLYTKLETPTNNLFDKNGKLIKTIKHNMVWRVEPLPDFTINEFDPKEGITEAAHEVRELERLYEELNLKFATLNDARQYKIAVKEYNNALVGKTHGENIIYDLTQIIPLFIKESNNYKFKKQAEVELSNLRDYLLSKRIRKTSGTGIPIIDKFASEVRGKEIVASEQGGEQTNLVKQLDYYIDNNLYDYDGEQTKISKYARVLQNYTSITALGLNPIAATANIFYGKIQTMIESISGNAFDLKSYTEARLYYDKAVTSYIGDIYGNKVTSEQNGLIHYFDVMFTQNEQAERDVNKKYSEKENEFYKKLLKTNVVFFMNNIGEHMMQNQSLFSMLISHRVIGGKFFTFNQFMEDKRELIDINLSSAEAKVKLKELRKKEKELKKEFESYPKVKDIFTFDKEMGKTKLKEEFSNINQREIEEFKLKVISMNHKLHGIYNKEDKNAINKWVLGRLFLQFKKWLSPGWNKRFGTQWGKEFYNETRQEIDKGTYTSLFQFVGKPLKGRVNSLLFKDFQYFENTMKGLVRDYSDLITRGQLHWFNLSANERANIISSVMELLYIAGMIVALNILKGMRDDDEELKQDKTFNFLMYQVDRLKTELAAYTPVYGWFNESAKLINSPAATWGTLKNGVKLGTSILYYPFQTDEQRTFASGAYSGEYKTQIYAMRMIPFYTQYQRLSKIDQMNRAYKLF